MSSGALLSQPTVLCTALCKRQVLWGTEAGKVRPWLRGQEPPSVTPDAWWKTKKCPLSESCNFKKKSSILITELYRQVSFIAQWFYLQVLYNGVLINFTKEKSGMFGYLAYPEVTSEEMVSKCSLYAHHPGIEGTWKSVLWKQKSQDLPMALTFPLYIMTWKTEWGKAVDDSCVQHLTDSHVPPVKQPCDGRAMAVLGHPEQGLIVNNLCLGLTPVTQ